MRYKMPFTQIFKKFYFNVAEPKETQPEPFPTALVVASVITVSVICIGLLVYFKKSKH